MRSDVLTTLMIESVTIALVFGLIVLTPPLKKNSNVGAKIFFGLCLLSITLAVTGGVCYLLRYQTFPGAKTLAIIDMTVHELLMLLFLYQWLVFVSYLVYQSVDHLHRNAIHMLSPIMASSVLVIVNAFTGILFSVDKENIFRVKPAYWIILVIEILYVGGSGFLIYQVSRRTKHPNFFSVLPFLIPFAAGTVATALTPYAVRGLGIAVGLVLVHFSLMNMRCYVDEKRGCFNRAYLTYLAGFAEKQGNSEGTQVLFSCDDTEKDMALCAILLEEKPDNCALIRIAEARYIVLVGAHRKSAARLLSQNVTEICEEENIEVKAELATRRKDESAEAFLQRFV